MNATSGTQGHYVHQLEAIQPAGRPTPGPQYDHNELQPPYLTAPARSRYVSHDDRRQRGLGTAWVQAR